MSESFEGVEDVPQQTQADYFGFAQTFRHNLPDGVSYIEFKSLDEGGKSKFQRETQRPVNIAKGGGASVIIDPAAQRHVLIRESVTGWNLKRGGREIPFNLRNLQDFLQLADPRIVEGLEKAIRAENLWLIEDVSSEQLREEINSLEVEYERALVRERGEASSASK